MGNASFARESVQTETGHWNGNGTIGFIGAMLLFWQPLMNNAQVAKCGEKKRKKSKTAELEFLIISKQKCIGETRHDS